MSVRPANYVRLGGRAATVRQLLRAGLADSMHLAIAPVVLGAGELLLRDIGLGALGYAVTRVEPSSSVTHLIVGRSPR